MRHGVSGQRSISFLRNMFGIWIDGKYAGLGDPEFLPLKSTASMTSSLRVTVSLEYPKPSLECVPGQTHNTTHAQATSA